MTTYMRYLKAFSPYIYQFGTQYVARSIIWKKKNALRFAIEEAECRRSN
jgi:hypothetical protein